MPAPAKRAATCTALLVGWATPYAKGAAKKMVVATTSAAALAAKAASARRDAAMTTLATTSSLAAFAPPTAVSGSVAESAQTPLLAAVPRAVVLRRLVSALTAILCTT